MRGKQRAAIWLVAAILALSLLGTATEKENNDKAAKSATNTHHKQENQTGNPANGEKIFQANCQVCHEAESEKTKVGPGLKGLFQKPAHKLPTGKQHAHTVSSIREQIEKGSGDMPEMGQSLSRTEIQDVIAYLQTL